MSDEPTATYDPRRVDSAVYEELRGAARALLVQQRPDASLSPTGLVHDAFLRLTAVERARWCSEAHFRAAAATAMRHILIDRARRRSTEKHGAGWARVSLALVGETALDADIVDLGQALEDLTEVDPRGAEIVQMRFLAGMSTRDIASVIGVSPRTVERDWRAARAWLLRALDPRS